MAVAGVWAKMREREVKERKEGETIAKGKRESRNNRMEWKEE